MTLRVTRVRSSCELPCAREGDTPKEHFRNHMGGFDDLQGLFPDDQHGGRTLEDLVRELPEGGEDVEEVLRRMERGDDDEDDGMIGVPVLK